MAQRRGRRATPLDYPRYGEVYDVDLEPVVGSEIGKRRPALIISNDINNEYADTVTVVPITGQPANRVYPFEVLLPTSVAGLTRDSRAKCSQIRTIDKRRLVSIRGVLSPNYVRQVQQALRIHLNLD